MQTFFKVTETPAENKGLSSNPQTGPSNPFQVAEKQKNAQTMVQAAVCAGFLSRPDQCAQCGERRPGKIQAHHDDYDEPLKVCWLCARCHRKADRARRLREGHRGYGYDFAEFLSVTGEYTFPHRYDPPPAPGPEGDYINRAIRSVYFAGFEQRKGGAKPMAALVLSCGHHKVILASELATFPPYTCCWECSDAKRYARRRPRRTQP